MKMNMRIVLTAVLTVFLFAGSASALPSGADSSDADIKSVIKEVYPSVVKVETRNHIRRVATGVVIDKSGYVVTTALITPRDDKVFIITSDGEKTDAEFVGLDPETHLAVVRAKKGELMPIKARKNKTLAVGDWIGVISISPENTPAVTQGIVSSVGEDKVRLNVWVVPGASGSPVVDKDGQMVGILRGTYVDEGPLVFQFEDRIITGSGYAFSRAEAPSSGMAIAVPADVVVNVAAEIKEKGKVDRGWLGVSIKQNEEGFVEIVEVEEESPAELARLREKDLVLRIDGEDVISTEMLAKTIRMRKPGDDIVLEIERSGETMSVNVKLGEYQEQDIIKEFEVKFPDLFSKEPALPEKMPGFSWVWDNQKYIGVYVQELNRDLSEYFGLDEGTGLLISKVKEEGPADKAGLKAGDVIVKADGERIMSARDFTMLIQKKEKSDMIVIEYLRDRKIRQVEVEIEEEESPSRQGFFGLYKEGKDSSWRVFPFGKKKMQEDKEERKDRFEEGSALEYSMNARGIRV